jgi:hypothetical protein
MLRTTSNATSNAQAHMVIGMPSSDDAIGIPANSMHLMLRGSYILYTNIKINSVALGPQANNAD